jgi:Peptidase inhibitor family I36
MTIKRSLVRAAIAAMGAVLLLAAGAPAATAATPRNGICEVGEICFYHFSNLGGSLSDFTGSLDNYGSTQPTCYEFRTPRLAGYLECMKNNAASVWNRTSREARVYFNSGYCGPYDTVGANSWRNLSVTYYENASHQFSPYPVGCH